MPDTDAKKWLPGDGSIDAIREQHERNRDRLKNGSHPLVNPYSFAAAEALLTALTREVERRREAEAAARLAAIEECAKIADDGAELLADGPEIKFISANAVAADLAKDIADAIRALANTPDPETVRR